MGFGLPKASSYIIEYPYEFVDFELLKDLSSKGTIDLSLKVNFARVSCFNFVGTYSLKMLNF